ncbi:MAG TPA: hypothetical protein VJ770_04575 [Stellaceae bacterium]|nr:hypothetical protein [Stellaceae bacterium]
MPRLLKDFAVTEPGAVGTYAVDFAQNVPAGTGLASAQWALGIHYTAPGAVADPMPQMRLSDAANVSGTVTAQRIAGLVAGNDYLVTVSGTMSDGAVVVLWTVLPCRAPQ